MRHILVAAATIALIAPAMVLGGQPATAEPNGYTFDTIGRAGLGGPQCTGSGAESSYHTHDFGNGFVTDGPTGLAAGPDGKIYSVDEGGQRVIIYPDAAHFQRCSGAISNVIVGPAGRSFVGPEAIAIGPDNTIYVSDTLNQTVDAFVYLPSGAIQFTAELGTPGVIGSASNQFAYPRGLAVNASGQLFVADDVNNRVQVFNTPITTGQSAVQSIRAAGNGGLAGPKAVAVDGSQLYVADYFDSRVLRFSGPFNTPGADYTASATLGPVTSPVDMTISSGHSLYVTDQGDSSGTNPPQILKWTDSDTGAAGAPAASFDFDGLFTAPGPDAAQGEPFGVMVDSQGVIYVSDYAGLRVLKEYPPNIANPDGFVVTSPALVHGKIYQAYPAETFHGPSSVGTITWKISNGSLPPGLTMSSAGQISGTPTKPGTYPCTVVGTSAKGVQGVARCTITVDPFSIVQTSAPAAYIQGSYSFTLTTNGGKTPLTWSLAGGALPAGLALNAITGQIAGKATALGTSTFTVRVADSHTPGADVAEQTFTVVVNPMTASLTLTPGPDYVYVALKTGNKISVLGGTSTRKFTVTGGALPPGVVLSATSGALSGTPSKAGTFLVTFHVADSVGNSATLSTSILITGMTFTTYAKSSAKVGVSYSSTVKVSGGKATIVYSATGLPPGLKISAAGAISGTPTTAGSYQVSVTATDHGTPVNTATASMPITVTG